MSRKVARELSFKVIFSFNFQSESESIETLINNLESETNDITKDDKEYIKEIVKGIIENKDMLDETIKKYLKEWTMDRISKTDLAILRLAIFEILYRDDIPYKVSVNEAVELAKCFSEDSSPSFINGVLAGVISGNKE